jgi:phosphoglycolate phosphatase-like HAD superfamily hydrolase
MTHQPSLLALFDIDGTLILSGRAGVRALGRAFEQRYGVPGALEGVAVAGRTDRAILIDVLTAMGLPAGEDDIAALRDAYCASLAEEILRPVVHPSGVLPGVARVLEAWSARGDVGIGLLTGNFRRGAEVKLGHFDLWHQFAFGAFGDDHVNRRDLVPVARTRAAEAGLVVPPPDRVIVIGDTPLDVDCAKAHGLRSVGVATGTFSRDALASAGADLVLDTLEDLERLTHFAFRE